jgi:hypothetical protein
VTYESTADGLKATMDIELADGQTRHIEYTAKEDDTDYPVTGSPTVDTVSVKRVAADTLERTEKKAGKVVQTVTQRVSKDGKTMTVSAKGIDAHGRPIDDELVLEKQ